eukprot:m.67901 g.67901  ORF g.67901 m.67901 type:complete len:52 (-) comp11600_c0_seq1:613-768(-)
MRKVPMPTTLNNKHACREYTKHITARLLIGCPQAQYVAFSPRYLVHQQEDI